MVNRPVGVFLSSTLKLGFHRFNTNATPTRTRYSLFAGGSACEGKNSSAHSGPFFFRTPGMSSISCTCRRNACTWCAWESSTLLVWCSSLLLILLVIRKRKRSCESIVGLRTQIINLILIRFLQSNAGFSNSKRSEILSLSNTHSEPSDRTAFAFSAFSYSEKISSAGSEDARFLKCRCFNVLLLLSAAAMASYDQTVRRSLQSKNTLDCL